MPDFDSLMIHRSCIALCEIRYRAVTLSPNCSEPQMNKTGDFPPGMFGDVYSKEMENVVNFCKIGTMVMLVMMVELDM